MARFLILCIMKNQVIKATEMDDPIVSIETAINLATAMKDANVYLKDYAYPDSNWVQYKWSQLEQNVIPRPVVIT